jgi:hypothetical protein
VVGGADGKSASSYPGFDASKDYFYGNELRHIVLETGRATGRTLPNGKPEILRTRSPRTWPTAAAPTCRPTAPTSTPSSATGR